MHISNNLIIKTRHKFAVNLIFDEEITGMGCPRIYSGPLGSKIKASGSKFTAKAAYGRQENKA